ncbi:MAG: GGDEF domain-containing protein [Lachnospiraceae bacterium]|nr:GGDEF domain-containing protein [Lachnospiraceae bacterium]MDY5741903.1 GGDEF domain-containing protein [Lachnospiraceae bacterium]
MESIFLYGVMTGIALGLFIFYDPLFKRRTKLLFCLAILLTIIILPIRYFERQATAGFYSVDLRRWLSAAGYIVKLLAPYTLFRILAEAKIHSEWKKGIPLLICSIICLLTPFTGWVFIITPENIFLHGPLYLVPHLTGTGYLVAVLYRTIKNLSHQPAYELKIGMAVATQVWISFVIVNINSKALDHLYYYTIPTCLVFYYCLLYIIRSKQDQLTGALNHFCFQVDIHRLSRRKQYGLIAIDINNIKQINDTYGHRRGDEVIRHVPELLLPLLPSRAKIYRIGGDEFVIIWNGIDESTLSLISQEIRQRLSGLPYGAAVGTALYTEASESPEKALHLADLDMYRDKLRQKEEYQKRENHKQHA